MQLTITVLLLLTAATLIATDTLGTLRPDLRWRTRLGVIASTWAVAGLTLAAYAAPHWIAP